MSAEGRYLNASAVADYLSISRNMVDILVRNGVLPKPIALTRRLKRWDRFAIDSKLTGVNAPTAPKPSAADISREIADDILAERRLSPAKDPRKRPRGHVLPLASDGGADRG